MRLHVSVLLACLATACSRRDAAPKTAAQLTSCSPLVWLIDNLLVLDLPASGGWTLNQQPVDSAALVHHLHDIYARQPANRRLLLVQAASGRREADPIGWILAPLESLRVVVVQRPYRRVFDSAGRQYTETVPTVRSARVASALDSLARGVISSDAAARTIADEMAATCAFIAEDTVGQLHGAVRAELERRAGW